MNKYEKLKKKRNDISKLIINLEGKINFSKIVNSRNVLKAASEAAEIQAQIDMLAKVRNSIEAQLTFLVPRE